MSSPKRDYKAYTESNSHRTQRMNQVPDIFKRRKVIDKMIKQGLVAWGDISSGFEPKNNKQDTSLVTIEDKSIMFDSFFIL